MIEKRISLNAITTSIENESLNNSKDGESEISYKTIERRFKDFIKKCNVNIKELKDKNGEIYFDETEAIILKAILKESIDKNSFIYKLLKDKDTDISFNEIKIFMDNINEFMEGKISDDERSMFMSYLDQSLKYSVLMELHNIYNIIECLNLNMSTTIYTYHLSSLIKLREKLEYEFIINTVDSVRYVTQLAEVLELHKEISGEENVTYDECEDIALENEYMQRDKDVKKFLEENPLIREHIEKKLNKKIDKIF